MFKNSSRETFNQLVDALRPTAVPKVGTIGSMLLFVRQDTVRAFRPRVKVRWRSRMLDGDFGFFLGLPGTTLKDQTRIPAPQSLTLSSMMNYPEIVRASAIENDRVSDEMVALISVQLDKMPTSAEEVDTVLGSDFFEKNIVERSVVLTQHLRSTF